MKVPRRTALRRVASLVAVMVVATLAVMGVTSTVAMAASAMTSATSYEATTEDGVKVSVGAPQGAFPDDAALRVSGVLLQNTIAQDGLLTAELQGSLEDGQTVEYTWYRSLTGEDGTWEEAPLERVTGSQDNIVNDGKSMNVAYDSIAAGAEDIDRYWYYVKVTITSANGDVQELQSDPVQNSYYTELQNGSFETPDAGHWNNQLPNGTNGLIWLTTGTGDKNGRPNDDIELVNPSYGQSSVRSNYNIDEPDHGKQFAELNCEAYGALYQDVLTVPGTTLNWYLSHAGRMGTDEMALVIMPVDTAEKLTRELEEVSEDSSAIRRILNKYQDQGFIQYFEDGQGSWARYDGEYTVPEGQYVTRFFFVAVDTGATGNRANTTGNLLDRVGFGTDVPAPDADEGQLTITKVVSGVTPPENYSVEVAVDGEGSANDQTITLSNFTLRSDGTYSASRTITIRDMQAYGTESFDITETVKNAPTAQYAETSQVTVGGNTTSGKTAEDVSVKAGDTQQVTFTNTYEQYEQLEDPVASKKIRKNDDGTYTLALDILGDQVSGPSSVTTEPVDIVLVLDDSGSMRDKISVDPAQMDTSQTYYIDGSFGYTEISYRNGEWGYDFFGWRPVDVSRTRIYQTKTQALKAAVNSFIDQAAATNALIADRDDKIRISVVPYADNTKNIRDFTVCEGQGVSQLKATVSTLNSSNGDGATRADRGMRQAASYVADSDRPTAKKVVILFTDGEPNDGNGFDDWVAAAAVNSAGTIKSAGGSVYAVGVFEGADPTQDPTQSGTSNFNRYMQAVSSNYPSASASNGFNVTWGRDGSHTNGYYKSAEDASQLTSVFEDIFHSETETNGFSEVAITDTLSEYAQFVDASALKHSDQPIKVGSDTYYELIDGIDANGIKVVDGEGNPINDDQYTLYINEEKTSIRVVFKNMLEDDKLYSLMFNVKPTAKAEEEYANGGYPHVGEEGTDMVGNDTSSGHEGFRTNVKATYEWNGESAEYKHPVLQVDALKLPAFLQVTKTLNGAELTKDQFHFTVTAVDSDDKPSVDAAKFAWGNSAPDPIVKFDSGTPEGGENTSVAREPEALVFSAADADEAVRYSYIYEETEPENPAGVLFDATAWKVTLEAGKTDSGDIKVDVYIYKDADGKDESGNYTWTLCSLNDDGSLVDSGGSASPTHTFVASNDDAKITIPFVNTFVGYGLEIYKGVAKEDGGTIIADPDQPLSHAQFTVYQVADGTEMKVDSICNDNNIYEDFEAATDGKGYVTFSPLPAGTYYFKETCVPSGYQLMNQVVKMVVAESDGEYTATFTRYDINGETGDLTQDGETETKNLEDSQDGMAQVFKFDVANKPNPDLPSSGSSGTLIMMTTGFAAIALSGVYLAWKRGLLGRN